MVFLLTNSSHVILQAQETQPTQSDTIAQETARPSHTVTLKVKTNGIESTAGGNLESIDGVLSGIEGTPVKLKVTTNPGYRFVKYESYITDSGNSTDGLLPIENNTFDISDKIGNTTVYAVFESVVVDENVYFQDDFSSNNESVLSRYNLFGLSSENLVAQNGRLEIKAPGVSMLAPNIDSTIEETEHVGYQIRCNLQQIDEIKPWNTFRIAFKEASDGTVYVVEFNGQKVFIKKLDKWNAPNNTGDILAGPHHLELGGTEHQLAITVKGAVVSVTDHEKPIISYTSEDNWGQASPKVAFIPVSQRSTALSHLEILKTKSSKELRLIMRLDGNENPDAYPGIITGSSPQVQVGDILNIVATPKTGYRFEGFRDSQGQLLDLANYQVTENGEESLVFYADFTTSTEQVREAKTFYIDSQAGQDDQNGESEKTAWKSLSRLKDMQLVPGDTVLFKRGSRFVGKDAALRFKGSGSAEAPILITAYGEGERPLFEGQGQVEDVVSLYNQEYITIESLAITNLDANYETSFGLNANNNREKNLRGVRVVARDFGIVHDITLRDLHIHDVNGRLNAKWNGGIFFDANGTVGEGTPTKYDGILVENNILERVDRSGIKLVGSTWANQSAKNNPNVPINWYPSTNVVVRGNRIDKAGGDAITVRDTDGALIEYNVVSDSRYQNTGYNAGIWPFQASNSVIQYNEVFRTHGVQDGQGLDTDHASSNSVVQYNYSHDNEGGFMLIMNGFEHTAPTIRYNISQNDKDKTFEFARGTPAGTAIYNNTIYSDSKLVGRGGIIDLPNTKAGTGNRDAFFFNNVFYFVEGEEMYVKQSDALAYLDKFHFYNNAYVGVTPPEQESKPITSQIDFNAIGSGPTDNQTMLATAGKYLTGQLDGYKLPSNSGLVAAGVTKEEALAHFYQKLGVSKQVDFAASGSASLSPVEVFELALTTNSVDAIQRIYPQIEGVVYNTDFFGNSIENVALSVGAAQYTAITSDNESSPSTDEQVNTDNTPTQSEQQKTLVDDNTGIRLHLYGQDAQEGVKMAVSSVESVELPSDSSLHLPHDLYEIDVFLENGEKLQLQHKMLVELPIRKDNIVSKAIVLLATDNNYIEEELKFNVLDGYAQFEATCFSQYGLVYDQQQGSSKEEKNSSTTKVGQTGNKKTLPKTGEGIGLVSILIGMVGVFLLMLSGLGLKNLRRKK